MYYICDNINVKFCVKSQNSDSDYLWKKTGRQKRSKQKRSKSLVIS